MDCVKLEGRKRYVAGTASALRNGRLRASENTTVGCIEGGSVWLPQLAPFFTRCERVPLRVVAVKIRVVCCSLSPNQRMSALRSGQRSSRRACVDCAATVSFMRHLKDRGLSGVRLVISDACSRLVEALHEAFADAAWQRCTVHFYRNVFSRVPSGKVNAAATMHKAIHAQEDRREAAKKAKDVTDKLRQMKLAKAADVLEAGVADTLTYYAFPPEHWRRIRTNNPMERIIREVRRRTPVVGCLPDGNSALMLVSARLRHIAGSKWGNRRYLDMNRFRHPEVAVA